MKKKFLFLKLCLLMIIFLCLPGCGKSRDTKVVLTTGFPKDEVFRIETYVCTLPEIMVYLTNTQNQYESIFSDQIWVTDMGGVTLEQNVKDNALAQIAQIKTMNLLGEKHGITLNAEEQAKIHEAAEAYFNSLNPEERDGMQVTEKVIESLYAEYALADKVYQYIIKDINPEISDDEARTITVQQILIQTYALDGTGKKVEYSDAARKEAYQQAVDIRKQALNGEDFEKLIMLYNEDEQGVYSFGKGDMPENFEQAAFKLGKGDISDIVETDFGFYIIKCINTFNREETDANKVKIVEERREEVFGQEYNTFVASLTKILNDELWDKVTFIHDPEVVTKDFFDVYRDYFN